MANTYAANYDDRLSFNDMLDNFGLTTIQRGRIVGDGFTTMKELVATTKLLVPKNWKGILKTLTRLSLRLRPPVISEFNFLQNLSNASVESYSILGLWFFISIPLVISMMSLPK